jgi:hypothetical protein
MLTRAGACAYRPSEESTLCLAQQARLQTGVGRSFSDGLMPSIGASSLFASAG